MKLKASLLWTLAFLSQTAGCTSTVSQTALLSRGRNRASASCVRPTLDDSSPYRVPLAGAAKDPELLRYLEPLPGRLRRSLEAGGLEILFGQALRYQAHEGDAPDVQFLSKRQEIATRLVSLSSQLASLLHEVDCTGDVVESMMNALDKRERSRELKLTIASLVVGGAAGVVAGVWDVKDREGNGPPITAAAGAGATASLGVAAFIPRHYEVKISHEHNLLTPIVTGEDPQHMYPTFVFRLLTRPTVDGSPTPQEALLQEWKKELSRRVPSTDRPRAERLLYGSGGLYPQSAVAVRLAMFDQLESTLSALYREIELLERYVTRATTPD